VPGALIVGDVRAPNGAGSSETLNFYDAAPVSVGASRVIVGRIHDRRDPPGVFRPRVFIVCFDSRSIFVYDPAERRVDALIRTGRGPHALVMDPVHPIAYVGHFTDSYIGLIDLDQSHALFGTIVATIGIPTSPQGTK
jgi:DNA-binding beta-propeller fold protein YncE